MKNKKIIIIFSIIIVVLLVLLFGFETIEKKIERQVTFKEESIETIDIPNIIYSDTTNTPIYINGDVITNNITNEDDIWIVLNKLSSYYHFKDAQTVFNLLSTNKNNGITFYKLQQKYNDVIVYGKQLVIAVDENGNIISIQGNYYPNININTSSSLTADNVKEKYLENINTINYLISDGVKYIYIKENTPIIVYYYSVIDDINGDYDLFLNATDGTTVDKISTSEDYTFEGIGNNNKSYSAQLTEKNLLGITYYDFTDSERNINIIDGSSYAFNTTTKTGGDNYGILIYDGIVWKTSFDPIRTQYYNNTLNYNFVPYESNKLLKNAVVAMSNYEKIYDYYKNKLNYTSYDNAGSQIDVLINVYDNPFTKKEDDNASWKGSMKAFFIGEHDGKSYVEAFDVLAHEYTHAVSGTIVNFKYNNESGALNESYSDILGNCIEGEDFDVGEDISQARSMSNPALYNQPNKVGGTYYFPDDTSYYNDEWIANFHIKHTNITKDNWTNADNGGVHINSGIPNYAAYLIYTNGGVDNFDELGELYFNSLYYLTSDATFEDSAYAVINAAKVLGYSKDKIKIIEDAFIETNMISNFNKVKGNVTDEQGNALPNTQVNIITADEKLIIGTSYTDNDGNYEISVDVGEYIIKYYKPKYSEYTENINISSSDTKNVSLIKVDNGINTNIDISFVIDISGSMDTSDPDKSSKVIMEEVLSNLPEDVHASLISFLKTANILNNGITTTIDKKQILSDISLLINDDGSTNDSGTNSKSGLTAALNIMAINRNTRKYIILLTDGNDNSSTNSDLSYEEIISKCNEYDIRILGIAIGDEANSDNIKKMAEETNGKLYSISDISSAGNIAKYIYEEIE